jgi:hypothetical protein
VVRSIRAFLRAANQGDRPALTGAIAAGERFREFSYGLTYGQSRPKRFFATRNRRTLIRHLLGRQARGDRIWLSSLDVNGYDRAFDLCNYGYLVDRRIAGGPRRPFVGKGANDGSSGRIAVWNTGQEAD